ncbi:MAG TPA: hypothetical protein VG896_01535 [Candidatus Nitrosotalea sp.]|nr:hypothetical protein [Candidatus Nitrosotalea sp.]
MSNSIEEILKKLESKRKDCVSFSKKYEIRKMDDLRQYYEGATWAIDFAISTIKENSI